ncbi:hypothetical protein FKO01_27780 [Mesorhizobium sp. B2-3-3]|nr:hypothetical protein FKO01_27780 [Mesorhizobium sp. B2-3-3]
MAAPERAGHPVRSSAPSPSCEHPGFGTPPPHRHACTATRRESPAGCPGLLTTKATLVRETADVYCRHDRFSVRPVDALLPLPLFEFANGTGAGVVETARAGTRSFQATSGTTDHRWGARV